MEEAAPVDWYALLLGTSVSAVSAFLCIHFFLRLIERIVITSYSIHYTKLYEVTTARRTLRLSVR